RILMLSVNPTDAALATWPGLDTFVRRVILRRPEERMVQSGRAGVGPRNLGPGPPAFGFLSGPELSWFRLVSRDLTPRTDQGTVPTKVELPRAKADAALARFPQPQAKARPGPRNIPVAAVAEWDDTTALPRLCRDELERASGISI